MGRVNDVGDIERIGQRALPYTIEAQYLIKPAGIWHSARWTAWRLVATFKTKTLRDAAMQALLDQQPDADFRAVNYRPLRSRYPFITWTILLALVYFIFHK